MMWADKEASTQFVLVLGSRPGSAFPDLRPSAVYTANGAASKALIYKKRGAAFISCIVSSSSLKKAPVQERVALLKPNQVVARYNKSDANDILGARLPTTEIYHLTMSEQNRLQRSFFGSKCYYSSITMRWSKAYAKGNIRASFPITWIKEMLASGGGVSTGVFAILYALTKWPHATIVCSGIGMAPGGHHYDGGGSFGMKVAIRDRRLLPSLPAHYKARLRSTDTSMCELAGIRQWDGPILQGFNERNECDYLSEVGR